MKIKNIRRNFNTHRKHWKFWGKIQKIESKGKKIENRRERIRKVEQSRGMMNKRFKREHRKLRNFSSKADKSIHNKRAHQVPSTINENWLIARVCETLEIANSSLHTFWTVKTDQMERISNQNCYRLFHSNTGN